jgi:DNA-3-methyladenine glycosylase II
MSYEEAANHLASVDSKLAQVIERLGACDWRPDERPENLFQYLSRVIVYQQLSGRVASAIHRRFLLLFNPGLEPAPEQPWYGLRHPEPSEVAAADIEWLRTAGLSRQKASYIQGLASKCLDGLAGIEVLQTMDDEAVIAELTKVKGIGRWTVEMLLMFRMGRMDVWPVDDLGVRAGLKRFHGLETPPKPKEAMALGEVWRPYRSVAAYYMWQLTDTELPE